MRAATGLSGRHAETPSRTPYIRHSQQPPPPLLVLGVCWQDILYIAQVPGILSPRPLIHTPPHHLWMSTVPDVVSVRPSGALLHDASTLPFRRAHSCNPNQTPLKICCSCGFNCTALCSHRKAVMCSGKGASGSSCTTSTGTEVQCEGQEGSAAWAGE